MAVDAWAPMDTRYWVFREAAEETTSFEQRCLRECKTTAGCQGFTTATSCHATGRAAGPCCQLQALPAPAAGMPAQEFVNPSAAGSFVKISDGTCNGGVAGLASRSVSGALSKASRAAYNALSRPTTTVDCNMNPFFLGCGPPALASNSRMVHGPSGASDAALEADCESTGGFLAGCVALRQQGGSVPVGTAAPQLGEEAGSADGVSWSVFFGSLVGVFLLTMLTTALVRAGTSLGRARAQSKRSPQLHPGRASPPRC